MGIPVMVLGRSGSGKSASLRNFKADEISVINVANKPLPFRTNIKPFNLNREATKRGVSRYALAQQMLLRCSAKSIVIDDSQYLMAFDSFDRAKDVGYGKFTDIALNFEKLIEFVSNNLPDDKIVYFLHHCESNDMGEIKAKTIGKMLDNQLTVEGLFSIVLYCTTDGKSHRFITQSDGKTSAKSPMEMFTTNEIDNDLKEVDKEIRNYYNMEVINDEKN